MAIYWMLLSLNLNSNGYGSRLIGITSNKQVTFPTLWVHAATHGEHNNSVVCFN